MSEWLSAAALVVAAAGAALQWKQNQRIAGRVAAIEEARRGEELEDRRRATVSARFERDLLVIRNAGPAEAQTVDFVMGSEAKHGPFLLESPFPIDLLHPGQEFSMVVGTVAETAQRVTARLSWVDGVGPHEIPLTLSV